MPERGRKPTAICDGRRCAVYVFEFDDQERSPDYRKSIQYLDRRVERAAAGRELRAGPSRASIWKARPSTRPPSSSITSTRIVVVDGHLTDDDFSPSNPEYRFRR